MTVPGKPILIAAAILAVLLIAAVVDPLVLIVALGGDVLLVAVVYLEGMRLKGAGVTVSREGWTRVQLSRETEFVYRIENRGDVPVSVLIRQPWPVEIEGEDNRVDVLVEPGEVVHAALVATPRQRGRVVVPPTEVDIRHVLGLARRRWSVTDNTPISVFPNLAGLREYDLLRRSHALRQLGIHRIRMVGAGRDFDQLRDYQHDDNYADINWKATARNNRPISTMYQAEKSQDVLLCLDCGRMMGNPVGEGATALDRAIDASIMLAHVCQMQGDRVGLVLFKDTVTTFMKPAAGTVAQGRIIQALVDAQPEGVFPSYEALVAALRANHKRRSIVFLFTDLNDPQLADDMAKVLPLISHRHVLVIVSLRDPLLGRVAGGPAKRREAIYRVLAARQLADERDAAAVSLHQVGIQVLESEAEKLPLAVVNRYLEVKTRQLL